METTTKNKVKKSSKKATTKTIETPKAEKALSVFMTGPHSDGGNQESEGKPPYWIVKFATDLEAEAKYSYRIYNEAKAYNVALKIAADQKAELVRC